MIKIPVETKPALWGFAAGAAAAALVGFNWGGWVTGSKAETVAAQRAEEAMVMALAPICAERFRLAGDATVNLVNLKKAESWSQGDFVEKGGWASSAGATEPAQVTAVAKACAALLTKT